MNQLRNAKLLFSLLGAMWSATLSAASVMHAGILVSSSVSPDVACMVNEMAKEEFKLSDSTRFSLLDYDGTIAGARRVAQDASKLGFDVVIGPLLSPESQATIPFFTEHQIPQLLPMATEPTLTQHSKYVVRMLSRADHYVKLAAQFSEVHLKSKRILIVSNDSLAYSRFYSQGLRRELNDKLWSGVFKEFRYIEGELKSHLLKKAILEFKPDLIYAPIYAKDIVELYSSAISSQISLNVLTHAGLFSSKKDLAKIYSPKVRLIFNGLWDQKSKGFRSEIYTKIVLNRCRRFEFMPSSMAVFDAMNLVATAHDKSPDLLGHSFVRLILGMTFEGFLGPTRFLGKQEPIRSLNLYELDRQKMKFLTSITGKGV